VSDTAATLDSIPFGTVGGEAISLVRALRLLKLDFSGEVRPPAECWRWVVERIAMQQAAAELGIEASAADVEAEMAEYRRAGNLYAAADTEQFLQSRACTVDDFAEGIEQLWIEKQLRRRYAEEPAERYFLQHSTDYDTAVLSELVVDDEGAARELLLQYRDEGADFAALVRKYSVGESREKAGFLGEVRRRALRGREAAAIFGAQPDDVVGPSPQGRQFRLLRIHDVRRAVLSDAVRAEITDQLWREWLFRRVRTAQPEISLLEAL
jgi:parvulin-like peptidyl-prolyl isomerase